MSYVVGKPVVVSGRDHPGHHRTPSYIKGKTGRIERTYGRFRNPESLAYGGDGRPETPLYLVSFERSELWPGLGADRGHRVYVDVYEHWLEEPT